MGAKESAEMKKARKLVAEGHSAYRAAQLAGISKQAIYMSNWYKELKLKVK